jgi:hypothetical protein
MTAKEKLNDCDTKENATPTVRCVTIEVENRLYDVKKHLSVPFRNAIFRGIIATERCCIIVSLSF